MDPTPPTTSPTASPASMPLWPEAAPGAIGNDPATDIPTLTCFSPPDTLRTGAAFLVLPGGGYAHLAPHEGEPIARWINSLGIFAAVLAYRHAPRYRHPAPITDARRAIRTLRHRSHEFGIDRTRIGILGSSAGGHLAATASTLFDEGDVQSTDPIERQSSLPNLAILLYPVISLIEPFAHVGSRDNLLGPKGPDDLKHRLSPEKHVTAKTPPTFIFHTADDPVVPMENALAYAGALHEKKIPVELHLFESGPHGVGLALDRPDLHAWTSLAATWLGRHHFASHAGT